MMPKHIYNLNLMGQKWSPRVQFLAMPQDGQKLKTLVVRVILLYLDITL